MRLARRSPQGINRSLWLLLAVAGNPSLKDRRERRPDKEGKQGNKKDSKEVEGGREGERRGGEGNVICQFRRVRFGEKPNCVLRGKERDTNL